MSHHQKIIWQEGMFLQPQHFQQQERYFEYIQHQKISMLHNENWGITALEINQDLLRLGKISIDVCCGILPDGTVFNIPEKDSPPLILEIPDNLKNTLISLALPLKRNGFPETQNHLEPQQGCRYYTDTLDIRDSNHGADISVSVRIGKLSLLLLLENENRDNYTYISIARIKEFNKYHGIILDNTFIPSCLDAHASLVLNKLIIEIHGLLDYRANMLVERLKGLNGGNAEFSDFVMLQLINRFEPLFKHLAQGIKIHPEKLYQCLLQLSGELSTFTSPSRREKMEFHYQHNDLENTFMSLQKAIRQSLSQIIEENTIPLLLEERDKSTWVSIIPDKTLFNNAQFILAVHAKLSQEELRKTFLSQVKIAPVEEIRNLVNRALPGIELQMLPMVPRQLPYYSNYVYFLLNSNDPLWKQNSQSTGLAFHIGGIFPDLKLEFWAIKG